MVDELLGALGWVEDGDMGAAHSPMELGKAMWCSPATASCELMRCMKQLARAFWMARLTSKVAALAIYLRLSGVVSFQMVMATCFTRERGHLMPMAFIASQLGPHIVHEGGLAYQVLLEPLCIVPSAKDDPVSQVTAWNTGPKLPLDSLKVVPEHPGICDFLLIIHMEIVVPVQDAW